MANNFHGFCSYPHGGRVMLALTATCAVALASTMWGVSSCRFVFVDYESDRGDMGVFYLDPTPDNEALEYRTGAGLFTWLDAYDPNDISTADYNPNPQKNVEDDGSEDWTKGQCIGYTTKQRETFSDTIFEVARVFATLSVLGGIGVMLWIFSLACLSLGEWQIWTLRIALVLLSVMVAFTFLIFSSGLCNGNLAASIGYDSQCTMDQGGLVVIAGCLLWAVAALIAIVYIKPPSADYAFRDGHISNEFQRRRLKQLQKKKQRAANSPKLAVSTSDTTASLSKPQAVSPALSSPQSIYYDASGATEVQLMSNNSPMRSSPSSSKGSTPGRYSVGQNQSMESDAA